MATLFQLLGTLLHCIGAFLLMVVVAASGALPTPRADGVPLWVSVVCGILGLAFNMIGAVAKDRGRRLALPSVNELLARDHRRPVLLLRSFRRDNQRVEHHLRVRGNPILNFANRGSDLLTFEEAVVGLLQGYGPVIALGQPREPLPPLGAARAYVPEKRWMREIGAYAARAARIVVIADFSPSLVWEVKTLSMGQGLSKMLFIIPLLTSQEASRWYYEWEELRRQAPFLPQLPPTAIAFRFNAAGVVEHLECKASTLDDRLAGIAAFLAKAWAS
ncbi:hypothetical protein WME76_46590 (plasmid) [Sorangium sp. So ce119]|uniref:hypothetical protein n=1 Tax=Sorangium sp. So ce119 TaxID=3133279 RepID=UPI003F60B8F2